MCRKEHRNVPTFVEEIISVIEAKGLDMDGLYRISGNITEVQKVRYQVDHGKFNFKDFDIHVLSGSLKTFFRELEDSLIPGVLRDPFIETMSKLKQKNIFYKSYETYFSRLYMFILFILKCCKIN